MTLILKSLGAMVKAAIAEHAYSPDIGVMTATFEKVPVFVYGTEKWRCHEHNDVLKGHIPIGFGYTGKPSYVLGVHRSTRYPVGMYNPAHPAAARIYGELYLVPLPVLWKLDEFHQNNSFMKRGWRSVECYHVNEGGKTIKTYHQSEAIIYTGNPKVISMNDYFEGTMLASGTYSHYLWTQKNDATAALPLQGEVPWTD